MDERAPDDNAPRRPARFQRLGVVGLGLIGGSVARAARAAAPELEVVGVDRSIILDVAEAEGVITSGVTAEEAGEALANADLVVLCLPVRQIAAFLGEHREALAGGPVVTDTGSTKAAVEEAAAEAGIDRFVGGHPMAGKPHGGLAHAESDLFLGATWFLCPGKSADTEAITAVRRFVRELGARPVEIDAKEHDRAVALTSHLPHVVVNALCEAILDEGAMEAAGGSLTRLVEIAGAPFETWGDTLATNQRAVAEGLREVGQRLSSLADQLDDEARLRELFARGRACRERVLGEQSRPHFGKAPGAVSSAKGPSGKRPGASSGKGAPKGPKKTAPVETEK